MVEKHLLRYDEDEETEYEFEYIKENWEEYFPELDECPDDETIRNQMGYDFLNFRLDDFLSNLGSILDEKSSDGCWESPDYEYFDEGYPDAQFCPKNSLEFIDKLIPLEGYHHKTPTIDVFEYKDGLELHVERDETIALPACKSHYYRDWENDGICISQREEDEDFYNYLR